MIVPKPIGEGVMEGIGFWLFCITAVVCYTAYEIVKLLA